MDSTKRHSLTKADINRLKQAMAQSPGKGALIRFQSLLMLVEGAAIFSGAQSIQRSVRIIYKWLPCQLQTHKPASLNEALRSGRPLSSTSITDKRILAALIRHPPSGNLRLPGQCMDSRALS